MFFELQNVEIAGYADDNTPYVSGETIDFVIEKLEKISVDLFSWFTANGMKANADKCHLLLSSASNLYANISDKVIQNSKSEKLLGVIIDSNLKFEDHILGLCKKANQKLSALSRICNFMSQEKKKI